MQGAAKRIARDLIRDIPGFAEAENIYRTAQDVNTFVHRAVNYGRRKMARRRTNWMRFPRTSGTRRYRAGYDRRNVGAYRRGARVRATHARYRYRRAALPELKNIDGDTAWTAVPDGGLVLVDHMAQIAQGDEPNQRDGRKVHISKIHITISIAMESQVTASAGEPTQWRIILYQDKQCNGTAATIPNVLDAGYALPSTAYRNLNETSRFRILWDKQFVWNQQVWYNNNAGTLANVTRDEMKMFHFNKKVHIPIMFNAATGSLATCRSNSLGIMVIRSNAVLTGADCIAKATYRLRFQDG